MLGPLGIQVKISWVVKVMTVCIGRTTMDFDDDCDHTLTQHGLMKSVKWLLLHSVTTVVYGMPL
jgi:hypothetical protein